MRTLDRPSFAASPRLAFHLPPELEAGEPPEARGLPRDGVRMMVAERASARLTNSTFAALPSFLRAGDLVVVNTSAVIPAAVRATTGGGMNLTVHLSTKLDAAGGDSAGGENAGGDNAGDHTDGGELWVVELRRDTDAGTTRWTDVVPRRLVLGRDATLELLAPHLGSDRLWTARLRLPRATFDWLAEHGAPIRYDYVRRPQPISAYQNVYANEPGSAEMPSAGRPFSHELITRLVVNGIGVAPLVLHTGVASLEATEQPYPERLRVPASTAAHVNETKSNGGRIIAVGTTVVRALETAADRGGHVAPADGWTDLMITPDRGVHVVDGLVTGWHEPQASHLLMLEAIAGRELLELSYAESLRQRYLWHEFGDIHLILP